jgi:NAD(P)H-hydrate epimerase
MALASRAALCSGAGLVSTVVPAALVPVVAGYAPEAMVHAGAASVSGALAADCLAALGSLSERFNAVLAGPGMTASADTRAVVEELLDTVEAPVVLDADALNALAGSPAILRRRRQPTVITPHPGELGRLMGLPTATIQADRPVAARDAASATGAVVVLKGAGTVVADPGGDIALNLTGNPGLASGGTGDVLAGLLAGLLAQGFAPLPAARTAVYIHGRAGDRAAWRHTQAGARAGDVAAELPLVLRELLPR